MTACDDEKANRDTRHSIRAHLSTPTFQRAQTAERRVARTTKAQVPADHRSIAIALTPLSRLTRREQDVLALLCLRWTNAEMAAQLSVSIRTIETHVAHIIQKLGVPNRRDAAALAGHTVFATAIRSEPHD